jgi:hypothetical protein
MPGNNCLARGPVEENLKNCVKEGKVFDGRRMQLGELCCSGLAPADYIVPVDGAATGAGLPPGCDYAPGPPGLKVCLACGDHVCGGAEDRCNCPADCERTQP